MDSSHDEGRRKALRAGVTAAAGLGLALLATRAGAQAPKLDKAAVKYMDASAVEGKECDDCSQFVEGTGGAAGSCRIVAGAISPKGHCIAFSPKPRR
ncbi:high-potential iron-sulfur protein [Derxia lacustris]|uniref:high-potential iron-sulfur protein n=1 Tax=Derxia lacustris TaxID=764842 RepID=UPI001594BD19|nr:high-potential iron-sulfur protein [Derxia lacustris]